MVSIRKNIKLIILSFLIMAVFGFLMNLKGTVIPSIKSEFNVNYSSIGFMIFIGDMAYMLAVFLGGIAIVKFGLKTIFTFGFVMIIISITWMFFVGSFASLILTMFLIGAGMGCFEIGLNCLGAQIFITNTAIMMNSLHFFSGVGASISPKYAGWLLTGSNSWRSVYLYSLIIIFIVFIFLITTSFANSNSEHAAPKAPLRKIIYDKKAWLFAGILGLSIVAEIGIGNWLINYLQVVHGMNEVNSTFCLTLFFIIFTVSRIAGGFIVEKIGYLRILLYFTSASIICFASGLALGERWIILFSVTGLFISIMYPTVMTLIIKEYTSDTPAVMGFIVTTAGAINMISSWVIGKTSDLLGVYAGFASLIMYSVLMMVLLLLIKGTLCYNKPVCKAY